MADAEGTSSVVVCEGDGVQALVGLMRGVMLVVLRRRGCGGMCRDGAACGR